MLTTVGLDRDIGMQEIGLIGVGEAGAMFMDSLLESGYAVTCYDRGHRIGYAEEQGATIVSTRSEVADRADAIVLSVTGTSSVETVMEGDDGLLNVAAPGQTIMDTSTIEASTAVKYQRKCAEEGIHWVSSPWTSNAPAGGLIMLPGGDDESVEAANDLIEACSTQQIRFDDVERALVFKYLMQIRYAARVAIDAEIVGIANAADVDAEPLNSVLEMDLDEELFTGVYAGDGDGLGALDSWEKDLGYAVEYGHGTGGANDGIAMPLTSMVHEVYKHGNRVAEPDERHAAAIARYWQALNGD